MVNTLVASRSDCFAIRESFVDTVGELKVYSCLSQTRTSYPAFPSLQWVPWALVPHLLTVLGSAKTAFAHPFRFACRSLQVPLGHTVALCPSPAYPSQVRLIDAWV